MVTLVYQGNLFKVDPQYWSYGFVWELLTHATHLLIIVCMQIAILDKPISSHINKPSQTMDLWRLDKLIHQKCPYPSPYWLVPGGILTHWDQRLFIINQLV